MKEVVLSIGIGSAVKLVVLDVDVDVVLNVVPQ